MRVHVTARHPGKVGVFSAPRTKMQLKNAFALVHYAWPIRFPCQRYVYADRLPHETDVVVMPEYCTCRCSLENHWLFTVMQDLGFDLCTCGSCAYNLDPVPFQARAPSSERVEYMTFPLKV